MHVPHIRKRLIQSSKLVEMGCEEAEAANASGDVSGSISGLMSGHDNFTDSLIAHAKPNPSYVDVPRPSSSMIINESFVAD